MTEANLYKHRFDLLTGLFDRFKGVIRLRTRGDELEMVAKAVAYEFHRQKIREANETDVKVWAISKVGSVMPERDIIVAVDELIHPCDVLIRANTGRLDFGHLRFQEYLVARELAENREIDIAELLDDPWWHDALVLYAQIAREFDWILDSVSSKSSVNRARATLDSMFKTRKEPERSELLRRLAARAALERVEGPSAFKRIKAQGPSAVMAAEARYNRVRELDLLQKREAVLDMEIDALERSLHERLTSLERSDALLQTEATDSSGAHGTTRIAKRKKVADPFVQQIRAERSKKTRQRSDLQRTILTEMSRANVDIGESLVRRMLRQLSEPVKESD